MVTMEEEFEIDWEFVDLIAKSTRKYVPKKKCPHGLCDGSGFYDEGQFDDIQTVKCLCKIEEEEDPDAYRDNLMDR